VVINRDKRMAFISVPHTASRAVSSVLLALNGWESVCKQHSIIVPDGFSSWAVVRNPFDRMKGHWRTYLDHVHGRLQPAFNSFGDYMTWAQTRLGLIARSMVLFMKPTTEVIYFEDISDNKLPQTTTGVFRQLEIPVIGKSNDTIPNESEYFETIFNQHLEDFETFGYASSVVGKV